MVSASMFVWWAIASTVFTVISSHTSGSTPSQPWNVSVIVLSWLTTLLWGISWFIVIFPNFLSSVSRPRRQRLEPSDSHNMNTRPLVPQTSPDLRVRVGNGQMTPTRPTAPPAPYTMSSEINGHVNNDMPTYTIV